jgi:sulfite exporter TauE/SafE
MDLFLFQTATDSTGWILLLGFLFGLQHATETDHLAAVSTIVSERKSLFDSAIVGGFWGVGHTLSLLAAGVLVLFFKFQLFKIIGGESEEAKNLFEFVVGVMLVFLGLNLLRNLYLNRHLHTHTHTHDGHTHTHFHHHHEHAHTHEDEHHHSPSQHSLFSPKALIVGMIHGLAGSGVLIVGVASAIESPTVAILYLIVFGIGSIGGMMLMSLILALPLHFTALRFHTVHLILCVAAALISIAVGLQKIYEEGFAKSLLG